MFPGRRLCLILLAPMLLWGGTGGSGVGTVTSVSAAAPQLQLIVAVSDLVVGRNRFTFGLLANNHPVNVASVKAIFYSVHGKSGKVEEILNAKFNDFAKSLRKSSQNSAAEDIQGVYVSYPTFKHAGQWVVEGQLSFQGKTRTVQQGFVVLSHSRVPRVGSPAPRSHNPTIKQMPATKLDSGRPPDDMHKLSIAQAIAQHKPLVVLFSTPAFCTSRMCGPQTEIVEQLEGHYRGQVNFIHIEIYKNANPQYGLAPTMIQWHLESEPWVFVINRRGIISSRFEGPTSGSEIAAAIKADLKAH